MPTNATTLHLTSKNFTDETSHGVAMVDFWATWCPPCRALTPTIDALASEYQGRVAVGKVNVDQERGIAGTYGVQSIPTIVFLRDGEEVARVVGLRSRDELARTLDGLLAG